MLWKRQQGDKTPLPLGGLPHTPGKGKAAGTDSTQAGRSSIRTQNLLLRSPGPARPHYSQPPSPGLVPVPGVPLWPGWHTSSH